MRGSARNVRRFAIFAVGVGLAVGALAPSAWAASSPSVRVVWMQGVHSAGTPSALNKVGVVEVGRKTAKNVLVLEPGTSAGGGYFVPLAKWITATAPGWQVWSVERRENLLEDQSVLNLAKEGKATSQRLFDYYLGYLTNSSVTNHFKGIPDSSVAYARQWGMAVAVGDLHRVITTAKRLGGHVVLGGHSLGGSVVTAYATWDFNGKAGAVDLAGLVFDDGASFRTPVTAAQAQTELTNLQASSPWLTFGNFPAPYAGLYNATGSTGALIAPNALSLGQGFSLLPAVLKPPVPATNLAQYGYALDTKTSPSYLVAAQAHLGQLAASGSPRGWDRAGALTPITRFAQMFSGTGLHSIDGTEWYFPQRLTDDTGAIGNGNPNPAQAVLGVRSTHGHDLPKRLRMLAFGAALGGAGVVSATTTLANQSHIPLSHLTLLNRQTTYAHNDPASAYPRNAFFSALVPFLAKVAALHR